MLILFIIIRSGLTDCTRESIARYRVCGHNLRYVRLRRYTQNTILNLTFKKQKQNKYVGILYLLKNDGSKKLDVKPYTDYNENGKKDFGGENRKKKIQINYPRVMPRIGKPTKIISFSPFFFRGDLSSNRVFTENC